MNQEIDIVSIENGKQYAVIDEINEGNNTFVYLTNILDETDFCIRKVMNTDSGKMLVGLKNKEEFDNALVIYANKNSGQV